MQFNHPKSGKMDREHPGQGGYQRWPDFFFLFFLFFVRKAESKIATHSANSVYSC